MNNKDASMMESSGPLSPQALGFGIPLFRQWLQLLKCSLVILIDQKHPIHPESHPQKGEWI
ncbi:MAG: hypothetical protein IIB46_00750 [Nitrospinae bacterium]|nr:hypothetical protein [Nitrospinota bacterium]